MILHGYWRSTASYRVRIALNLKGLVYSQATYDLRQEAHRTERYAALNPQRLVPALVTDEGTVLTQSSVILEWLEERYPAPPLLPADPGARASVRSMAALIACDVHPLNNLRVLNALRDDFAATPEQVSAWISRWSADGFTALEALIGRHGGRFAFGDAPTLADCHLVPQVYGAERFGLDLFPFPLIRTVAERVRLLPPVIAAHPSGQPDADP